MSTSVTAESISLPHGWEVPTDLRIRFGKHSNHQRAAGLERHLLIRLHRVPPNRRSVGESVYFWRNSTGGWKCSAGRDTVDTISELVVKYADAFVIIEQTSDRASTSRNWFEVLSDIGPLLRAADGLHETLQSAQHALPEVDKAELQPACDVAHEVVRAAQLLQQQAQHSIDYLVAQQNEQLAQTSQSQAAAAHRLNVMAAIFFPLATISSVFGMNISHGFENRPLAFWMILCVGTLLGVIIGSTVFKLRSWDPTTW